MDISVVILTYNEETHIRRCIEKVKPLARDIYVVDCFSGDQTVEIAEKMGAQVFKNPWEGLYSRQFNWALDHLPIRSKWVLRLDADEYLSPELIDEIRARLSSLPEDVTGIVFNLSRVFMGRCIRFGIPKVKLLRLFRYGKARCEQRMMDEHMVLLEGRAVTFVCGFADHNLNDIGWWTTKHNGYALREAVDLLDLKYELFGGETRDGRREAVGNGRGAMLGEQAAAKRRMKTRYARAPLFWRAFAYFCVRYFVRGGFLEGKEGFMWHFFQGLWYRMLVDAKVWEITRESGGDKQKILLLLREKYGMKI